MKKSLLALALIGSLGLGGCAALQKVIGDITSTPVNVVAAAQDAAVALCSFRPTIDTVTGIIAAGNPAIATASAVAGAICAAIASSIGQPTGSITGRRLGRSLPMVAGVPVRGTFVR